MNTYRNSEIVSAYRLDATERLVTRDGVRDASAGEWVVFGSDGTFLMSDAAFQARYDVWDSEDVPVVNEDGEFSPAGKTVDEVVNYLSTATGEEILRVKTLESEGGKRKGILEYVQR